MKKKKKKVNLKPHVRLFLHNRYKVYAYPFETDAYLFGLQR